MSAPAPPTAATRPASGTRRRRGSPWGYLFALPHGLGFALFTLLPIIIAIVMGTYDWPMLGERVFIGVGNFVQLIQDPNFQAATRNTVLFVVAYLPLNLIVSTGMALWISPKIRGRQFFRVLFFIPTVTPIVANVVVWRMLYQQGGVIDYAITTLTGRNAPNFLGDENWALLAIVFMTVWQGFGYNMLVFSAALDAVPESMTEAAAIDGASAWRIFWSVRLPMVTPSVFFATTMTLITSFQVFAQPFIMTRGGPGNSTVTMVHYIYNQGFRYSNLGLASAGATILFSIIVVITAIQFLGQKKWVHYE
ncbi:MAG: carbohydrate ABC transporter permease [Arachnia sp.]